MVVLVQLSVPSCKYTVIVGLLTTYNLQLTTMKDQSFTKAFEELEKITQSFEKGAFDLDEGLKQFERGLELAGVLKKKLAEVENKVEVIKKKFGKIAENAEEKDTLPF